jgi:5-methylcytosine-specific restriction endonuclease McrBC GTP-binding regulatory subunit McrB
MTDLFSLPTFELSSGNVQATAQVQDASFVVRKGSHARAQSVPSFDGHNYATLRGTLIQEGKLAPDPADPQRLVYLQDVAYSKPSAAAAVTLGRAANGRKEWRTPEGLSYGDWLAQQVGDGEFTPSWPPFFRALATRLLDFEERQPELVQMLLAAGVHIQHDEGVPLQVMDPFSFFSLILKHQSEERVLDLLRAVSERLNVAEDVPDDTVGVPWSNPMNAWFFAYRSARHPGDLPALWALARQTVAGVLDAETFARALAIRKVALPKLTTGLFWLNPDAFLALNGINVPYLERRGVKGAGRVQTLAELETVLQAARSVAPDFITLSHRAWLESQRQRRVAALNGDAFPFAEFREDAAHYVTDRVKGNLMLDRKYAPLLLELLEDTGWKALRPSRSPYTGREQLAVKVSLGGGVEMAGGPFGRALMFADDSGFEYVPFPVGLTLEVGLPDGRGDAVRQALRDDETRAQFQDALLTTLPTVTPASLTLNTDFGALKLLPLRTAQTEEVTATIATYAQGFGKNRQLRVGVTVSPAELESSDFPQLLEAALSYLDDLMGLLDKLSRMTEPVRQEDVLIEVPGKTDEVPSALFMPIPGVPLNQILYGPPGTGKTYRVVDEALAVLDPEFLKAHPGAEGRAARKGRYDQLAQQGRITFVTFHQSFGYEDFIEGIKPVMKEKALSYQLEDGVFLQAVRAAGGVLAVAEGQVEEEVSTASPDELRPEAQVWRMYIDGTVPVSQVRDRSVKRGELRMDSNKNTPRDLTHLGVEELSGRQLLFKDSLRVGDLVLLATGVDRIGAVGVVTGEYRFDPHSDPVFALDYAHTRSVRWLATGLNLSATTTTGHPFSAPTLQRVIGVAPADVLDQVLDHLNLRGDVPVSPDVGMRPHVLIIDEINRGNVSKIFGELITLLEAGKRAGSSEALTATLPLSRRPFSVPQSLYVIGTMNTADRSLTLLDAALRRRFVFRPVWPEPEVLPVIEIGGDALDLRKFLYVINERIERLLSREQVIGHAYLLGLPATLEGVASALRERILPLLEEYFFEDWSKIRTVLADDGKDEAQQFVQMYKTGGELRYRVNEAAFEEIEAFTQVYSRTAEADFPFSS